MAEIVRLLRWRGEWDGADLIAGTEKAAAAGERLQKAIQEVGDAGAPALKKTGTAAKETDEAFEGLGIEAKQVEMYLGRLEKGSGSPLVLQRNAELAAAAMNVMTQAAARAGQEIPSAFSGRVATAIETAKTQAAGMNAELEKMGGQTPTKLDKVIVALDKTAQSGERASRAIGSAAESTDRLAKAADATAQSKARLGDSIRKSTEGVTKFKSSALEAWGALSLGKTIGEALAKTIDKVDASMAAQDRRMADAAVNAIKFQQAMKLAEAGLIGLGGTQEQFLAGYDAYVEQLREGRKAVDEEAEALKRRKAAFDELVAGLSDIQKRTSFSLLSPEDAAKQLDAVKALAEGLNNAFEKAFQAGGEGERDKWAAANEEAVKKVTEAYQKAGLELPAHLKAIAQAHDDSASKAMEWAAKQAAAYDQVEAAAQRARDKESAARNFSTPVTGEFKAIQDAAVGAAAASGQFGTSLDTVAQKVVSLGGELRVGAPVLLQLAEAEDSVTAALYRRLEATKLLREEQEKSLGVADGWLAYIANIEDSMARGITSTTVGINLLADLQRQLQTFYAQATGDTKQMVDDVLDAIRALIATADGGGVLDVSPLADLERHVARKKEGR